MLPHLRGRPVHMPRFPDGIEGGGDPAEAGLHVVTANAETLVYLADQACMKRRGRLYFDTARNAYAQTAVAPYAVRALPGAPVACPLDWRELGRVEPEQFTVRNIARRLARKQDPWADIGSDARSLHNPQGRLAQLRSDS